MKRLIKIVAFGALVATVNNTRAQISTDLFYFVPKSPIAARSKGFGMNLLSRPLVLGYAKDPNHIEARFGGGFYTATLKENSIFDVPLESPQSGNSVVTFDNKLYGCNTMIRFSLSYDHRIVPYVDLFAGMRGFSCKMNVYPDSIYSPTMGQSVSDFRQFSYGISAGAIVSLGKHLKLDVGLTYSDANTQGQIINLDHLRMQSGSVMLNTTDSPLKMLMLKAGVVICFSDFKTMRANWQLNSLYPSSGSGSSGSSGFSGSHSSSGGGYSGGRSGGGGHVSVHVGSGRGR